MGSFPISIWDLLLLRFILVLGLWFLLQSIQSHANFNFSPYTYVVAEMAIVIHKKEKRHRYAQKLLEAV
jgi:hypothetical protein